MGQPVTQQRTTPAFLGWRLLLLVVLGLTPLGLAACAADNGKQPLGCEAATTPCLQGTAVVAMQTSKGPVEVTLDGAAAPLTAGNFVDLVRRGVYNGTVFHRVVREPVPFVVQGGDPSSADPKVAPSDYGSGGFVDPASGESRRIPLELKLAGTQEPRYGEEITTPTATRQLDLTHERGAISMARSNDPNSASAQFYVALQALPELDGRYAVFGRVTKGMEVIDRIQQGDKLIRAQVMEGGTLVKKKP
jgi:peptidyl-prolyl cis-trans isomerase B (cyclophilin B)